MSKSNPKKVVTTSSNKARVDSASTTKKSNSFLASKEPLIFFKSNYIWMGIGLGLVFLGFILMAGGSMPDDNTWDPSLIYSFRRTVLAPMVILAGLVVEIYAIFKKA